MHKGSDFVHWRTQKMLKNIFKRPKKPKQRYKKLDNSENASHSSLDSFSCFINIASPVQSGMVSNMEALMNQESMHCGIFQPLMSFKDVSDGEKMTLFIRKLSLCCTIFDFTKPSTEVCERNLKTDTLLEILDFVSSNSSNYSEPAILAVCKMCSMNLFRDFPPHRMNTTTQNDHDTDDHHHEPRYDPAWPHLHLVYDLLVRFITSPSLETKVAMIYIDYTFLSRLFDLFDSEDPRERECLKILLHKIYRKFTVHRTFIRKNISYKFYEYVLDHIGKHNGITELLEILGCIIAGFALPLKPEYKVLLYRVLIPMHKPKSLEVYIRQLTYCITQYIDKEPKLASGVIKGMLKLWPKTNSRKEVMFLSELEEILKAIEMAEFRKVMVPLFQRIGCCISSYSFPVADRAMRLWKNEKVVNLIEANRQVIFPIIFPALEHNLRCHWSEVVLNLTFDVRKMFQEMDDSLFNASHSHYKTEQENPSLEMKTQREDQHREISLSLKPIIKERAVLPNP